MNTESANMYGLLKVASELQKFAYTDNSPLRRLIAGNASASTTAGSQTGQPQTGPAMPPAQPGQPVQVPLPSTPVSLPPEQQRSGGTYRYGGKEYPANTWTAEDDARYREEKYRKGEPKRQIPRYLM